MATIGNYTYALEDISMHFRYTHSIIKEHFVRSKMMLIKEKLLKYSSIVSAILSPILLTLYYFLFYVPLTRGTGSLLGYAIGFELLLIFIFIFVCTLPLSCGLLLYIDYYTDIIYPKEWMSVTLVKKYKKYFSYISPKGGLGSSEYRYWFDFQDEEGNMYSFYGSTNEYECLIEGSKIQIHVKGPMIKEISLTEELN